MPSNIVEYTLKISDGGAKVELKKLASASDDLGDKRDKAGKKGKKAGSNLRSTFNKVGLAAAAGAAAIAGTTMAIAKLVSGLKDFTQEAVDMINDLGDIGNRSGVAAETIGALKAAFHASGQEASQVHQVLDVVAKKLGSLSRGSKAAEDAFKKYGIATKDLEGNLRSNNDILLDSMHVIQGLTDTSLRSRAAVELFGVGGQRLSQALGAGNFDKFLEFVNEFGAVAGPKAAKSAALFQDSLSLQNIAMEGFREELVISLGLMDRFAASMQGIMMFFAGMKEVVLVNKEMITTLFDVGISFANKFLKALNFVFNLGFVPMEEGLQGMVEGIVLLGAAMLRHMIKPIAASIALMSQFAALSDVVFGTKFMESIGETLNSLAELHDALDPNTARGFRSFQAFQVGAAKSMKLFGEITSGTKDKAKEAGETIEDLGEAAEETTEQIDHLAASASILNGLLSKLGIPRELQIGGIKQVVADVEQLTQGLFALGEQGKISQRLGSGRGGRDFDVLAQNIATAINKAAPKIGMAIAIATAGIKIAGGLGRMGETQEEIKQNVRANLQANIEAIERGLQVLPMILREVLPDLFVLFVDSLIFGFSKALAERLGFVVDFLRGIFTREGRQERRDERITLNDRANEFMRRLGVLGEIISGDSLRSGGRFFPSAAGGIKFTGAEQGLAMLHRGEFVVPETGQAPQAVQRSLGAANGGGIVLNINAAVVEQNAVDELVRQIERRFLTFGSSTSPLFGD